MRCFRARVTLQVHGGVHDLGNGALRASLTDPEPLKPFRGFGRPPSGQMS